MFTRCVTAVKEISKEEAQSLIKEAKLFQHVDRSNVKEVVAYTLCRRTNVLYCMYRLRYLPNNIDEYDEEELLEFARENIPEDIHFG